VTVQRAFQPQGGAYGNHSHQHNHNESDHVHE
jgi:hypothetical protein